MSKEDILKQRCERFRTIINEFGNRIYREDGINPIGKYVDNGLLAPNDLKFLSGLYTYESTLVKDADYYTQLVLHMSSETKDAMYEKIEDEKRYIKSQVAVIPRNAWERKRMEDIRIAMIEFLEAGIKIPKEWIEEYNELSDRQEKQNKTLCDECALQYKDCGCDCAREFVKKEQTNE